MIVRGVAYRKTDETDRLRSKQGSCSLGGVWRTAKQRKRTSYGRNGGPVDREGCGVPQNGGNGPPTVETRVLLIGRGVAYRKTGLHGILFISTVDFLQPPRAPVHPASTARYSTGYCSTTPPPSTVHPALHTTGSCSSTPPLAPLHCLLFLQPSTTPRGPVHLEATPPFTVHPNPPATLTIHPIDRLQ